MPNLSRLAAAALLTTLAALALAPEALAGAGGGEFTAVYDTITEWVEGTLGRIIAVALVIVGLFVGIARQSLMAFGVGVGSALGVANAPTIIDNVVTTTLPPGADPVVLMPSVATVIRPFGGGSAFAGSLRKSTHVATNTPGRHRWLCAGLPGDHHKHVVIYTMGIGFR